MAGTDNCGRLFISYSRRNKERVYPLADALAQAGLDIWIDREEIDPLDDSPPASVMVWRAPTPYWPGTRQSMPNRVIARRSSPPHGFAYSG
jgi:hypothetical protein